ncbi:MAG: CDP-alcohol phosphatidyltransferase family protein [Flavobacteriales bacterium]|nr:CDP-alcohol phosphatidyltransferase family protein [Flavobacteriales bacterium]
MASILLASQGQLTIACGLVFAAAVFDVFDGLAARAMGGGTPLGAQLDSLADMVSFGVAPGMLIWFTFRVGAPVDFFYAVSGGVARWWAVPAAALVIPIASAWRLAKFNIDTRQTTGFLGLPTPANALFWASVPLAGTFSALDAPGARFLENAIVGSMIGFSSLVFWIALILGILMLSELPLPSLKFKHKGWKGNEVIFLLIGIGAVLALLYGILAVPLILIIYLLSPLWGKLFPKPIH